jgi:hypothetical protein
VAYIGDQSTLMKSSLFAGTFSVQRFDRNALDGGSRAYCILLQSWQI